MDNKFKINLGFGLNLVALALFFPGILLPMFYLNMEMMADLGNSVLTTPLVNKELSIIATVDELWRDHRYLVAFLIFFFSVMIPLTKTALVAFARFSNDHKTRHKLVAFVTNIGKWSMADVFVVAIFLAVLSTNHATTTTSQEINMGLFKIAFDVSSETLSHVGDGFYFFTAYCVFSLAGSQLFFNGMKKQATSHAS